MAFVPADVPAGVAVGARAGFWQRFAADFIDAVITYVAYAILTAVFHTAGQVLGVIVGLGYFTYFEGGIRGQTPGKAAMRIRVVSIEGGQPIGYQRALVRDLGRIVPAIPLYLGYLWMLWDPQRQTWHDKLGRAVVVPVDAYPVST